MQSNFETNTDENDNFNKVADGKVAFMDWHTSIGLVDLRYNNKN